jgi:transcriptional regulator with XRE-family HTH domain
MTRPSSHQRAVNGRALVQARLALGLTQAQVAERIKATGPYMDDSRVSKLELGKAPYPTPELCNVLTRVYKIAYAAMTAPCETCGREWSAACRDHPAGEEAGERRRQPSAA